MSKSTSPPGHDSVGTLYVVATPIGNLADMSERAVTTLQGADVIAAEDTRHSKKLLQHFRITTRLVAYHDHSSEQAQAALLALLREGKSLALIADAGTPLISDPGFKLVRAAREAAINVVPIPGASAALAALSVAGLPSDRFSFEGFPAAKSVARKQQLQRLAQATRTLVFYESSHRIVACLEDMLAVFGPQRPVFIGRELTKKFESHFFGVLGAGLDWIRADANQQKGEFVVVLGGAQPVPADQQQLQRALEVVAVLRDEMPLNKAAALASRLTGVGKNRLYRAALEQE